MTYHEPARTPPPPIPALLITGLLVVIAVFTVLFSYPLLTSPATSVPSLGAVPRREQLGTLGEADGAIPAGTMLSNNELPGIANLNPALLNALHQAAMDASNDGVAFFITSGWRSPEYQNYLLLTAVSEYGSEAEAARWVATPERSAHVSGDAVDIGSSDAIVWLSEHGAAYGLCQIYSNEPWHYELRPDAVYYGCPAPYADPTHDPRMQE